MDRQVTATKQNIFCTRCDTCNHAEAAYCVHCGTSLAAGEQPPTATRLEPRGRRCGACGIANPSAAIYCVNCGLSLTDGIPAPNRAAGYAPPTLAWAGAAQPGTIVQHIYVSAPPVAPDIPLLVRALWFLFVGLWAGQIWLLMAWFLNLTIIGLPLGMWMLNTIPQVMTLRRTRAAWRMPPDRSGANFIVRVVYFVLIGWWVSLLWLQLAWMASATVIGLPLGFLMFERTATVTTLAEQ